MRAAFLDTHPQKAYTLTNRRPRRFAGVPQVGGAFVSGRLVLCLLVLLLIITACSNSQAWPRQATDLPPQIEIHTSTTQLSSTQITSPASTSIPNPSPPPTSIPRPCLNTSGKIITGEIEDPALTRALPFRVYLPPCYGSDPETRYPSLYLLHGLQYSDSQWDDLGVDEKAETLITTGIAPPFLIIMPWHRTGIDPETATVDVLIPYIDRVYQTRSGPAWRAIGGLSRGGGIALRIGLRHPDLFSAIGLHSPANLYSRAYIAAWVKDIPAEAMPNIWIDIGDRDTLLDSAQELIDLLDDLSVPTSWQVNPGSHNAAYWSSHLEMYLRWYSSGWME
jgi:enterochelin esterase-like enzyme